MDRWNALELLVLGVILFAYFAPVVYTVPSPPRNCVFYQSPLTSACPNEAPHYASLTYALLGHGATYLSGYYSIKW